MLDFAPFPLDPRLDADTWPVCDLPLCRVLLARNAAWLWLIMVPRISGATELTDLRLPDQRQLWHEVDATARLLQTLATPDKLNIAMLGNIVRQLHIHVVARWQGDPGWPGPIWGCGHTALYEEQDRLDLMNDLRNGYQSV